MPLLIFPFPLRVFFPLPLPLTLLCLQRKQYQASGRRTLSISGHAKKLSEPMFMHQSIPPAPSPPPPPRATAGHLAALSVPGVGHLQILHNLPTSGPFPSFSHACGFLSEYNYTEGFTEKKQIGSSVKDRNKF